ncbi:hypothetical protein [Amycolatopsis sp. H20-H5]|uniref:hypothetical protein n=1 Tax=Amycolatopsis sp. H20-H5 TaxID=3046309 RepID=UPI002DB58301|nr:hypothetical protein [Amycolatopsis sp. H20-H5]MEC3974558.1 hypothetical protein [Amycolatopsis sp. H20-H5]
MTRAADSVSESVKTGALGLRKRAVEAGKAGAEATAQAVGVAEQKLVESAGELAKTSRRARKKLAKKTELTRKELKKSSQAARKEALARAAELRKPGRKAKKAAIKAAKAAGQSKRRGKKDFKSAKKDFRAALIEAKGAAKGERTKRRRWPWVLGLGVVAAGTAYALRSKQEPPVAPSPPRTVPTPPAKPAAAAKPTPTPAPKPATPAKPAAPRNGQQASSTTGPDKKN